MMRTFSIVKNGVARIMRSYGFDPSINRNTQDAPGAPDASDVIAKWPPGHREQVTAFREIAEADIPDNSFQDAWRDNGQNLSTDMPKAKSIHAERIASARERAGPALERQEARERLKGDTVAADALVVKAKAAKAIDLGAIAAQIGNAPNPPALSAVWPNELEDFR